MGLTYWIGWGIITAIYAIAFMSIRQIYTRRIKQLTAIIKAQNVMIVISREIAENYTKDTTALRKQIEELKGALQNDRE